LSQVVVGTKKPKSSNSKDESLVSSNIKPELVKNTPEKNLEEYSNQKNSEQTANIDQNNQTYSLGNFVFDSGSF